MATPCAAGLLFNKTVGALDLNGVEGKQSVRKKKKCRGRRRRLATGVNNGRIWQCEWRPGPDARWTVGKVGFLIRSHFGSEKDTTLLDTLC